MIAEERIAQEFESMFTPAELHADLVPYLTKEFPLDRLQHPLMYAVPYIEQMNNHYNRRYEYVKAGVAEALKEGDFTRYVYTHERPYRVNASIHCIENYRVSDEEYWELLGSIWGDSENIWQNLADWKRLLRSKRPKRWLFMEEEDRETLKNLPARLKVYRGCIRGQNENGMSWTLDKDKARWFSNRLRRKEWTARVLEKEVPKSRVFAYLSGRGESEVILL